MDIIGDNHWSHDDDGEEISVSRSLPEDGGARTGENINENILCVLTSPPSLPAYEITNSISDHSEGSMRTRYQCKGRTLDVNA